MWPVQSVDSRQSATDRSPACLSACRLSTARPSKRSSRLNCYVTTYHHDKPADRFQADALLVSANLFQQNSAASPLISRLAIVRPARPTLVSVLLVLVLVLLTLPACKRVSRLVSKRAVCCCLFVWPARLSRIEADSRITWPSGLPANRSFLPPTVPPPPPPPILISINHL